MQTSRDAQAARDRSAKLEEILILIHAELERLLLENSYLIEQLERRGDVISIEKFFERVDALRAGSVHEAVQRSQLENFQKRIRELSEEVDHWRGRCVDQTVKDQGRSQLELKLQEYEQKIVILTNELAHSTGLVQEKFRENSKLGEQLVSQELQLKSLKGADSNGGLNKFTQLLEEHVRLNEDLRRQRDACELEKERLQAQCNSYEEKLQLLLSEVDGLSQVLREYQTGQRSSLDTSSTRVQSYSQHPLSGEVAQLREQILQKSNEAREWQEKFIRAEMSSSQKDIHERVRDYEERIALFTSELERLNMLLQDKTRETEELRSKLAQAEVSEREKEILVGQTMKLNEIIAARVHEIEELKRKYQRIEVDLLDKITFTERASEYESRLEGALAENHRLNQLLTAKMSEMDELRQKSSFVRLVENENANLKLEISHIRDLLNKKTSEDGQVYSAKSQIELLSTEKGTLSFKLKEYTQRVEYLSKELERATLIINQRVVENDDLKFKLAANIVLLEDREKKMVEYQRLQELFVLTKIEVERLSLNKTGGSSFEPRALEEGEPFIHEFSQQINSELEFWRNKCSDLEIKLLERNAFRQGDDDKDARIVWLEDMLKRRNEEINEWRTKYTKLDAKTWSNEQLQANIEDLQGVIAKLTADNDRLAEVITEKGSEFALLASKSERLQNDLRENYQAQREVESLKEHISIQASHLANLESENNELRGKTQILLGEKAKYLRRAEDEIENSSKLMQMIDGLNREKQQLVEECMRGRSHSPQ